MKKSKPPGEEKGNLYDRIFKENAESIFMPLVEQILGMKIVTHQPLPTKFNKTHEREVDFLYQIKVKDGKEYLLHMEFQTKSEKNMIYRMTRYHALIFSKYKKPVKHIVIYLGRGTSTMRSALKAEELFKGFDLINLHQLNTDELLSSQVPEVVLLAVLSNFEKERAEAVLRLIVIRLKALSPTQSDLTKYLNQLTILSKIRNFDTITQKIIKDMPILNIDIEQDAFFKKGVEKGLEKGLEEGLEEGLEKGMKAGFEQAERIKTLQTVQNCYENGLDPEMTSKIANLPLQEVNKLFKQLKEGKNIIEE